MKKKAYVKNQIRTIFNTKARFLSIFCIVFLGAAFFAGLRHTPLIMEQSMNDTLSMPLILLYRTVRNHDILVPNLDYVFVHILDIDT